MNSQELEEGTTFRPRFDRDGLITAVCTDAADNSLLMVAYMNEDALSRTLETGEAWFWSRSRGRLWHKGATSGTVQRVVEMRVDCDQDAIWLRVTREEREGTCHTGRESCFYRILETDEAGRRRLRIG